MLCYCMLVVVHLQTCYTSIKYCKCIMSNSLVAPPVPGRQTLGQDLARMRMELFSAQNKIEKAPRGSLWLRLTEGKALGAPNQGVAARPLGREHAERLLLGHRLLSGTSIIYSLGGVCRHPKTRSLGRSGVSKRVFERARLHPSTHGL